MTISELQKQAHAVAKEKGWWDKERTWPEICCLIHSELSEALEEYRSGRDVREIYYKPQRRMAPDGIVTVLPDKPLGFPIELADTVIRILDYIEAEGACIDNKRSLQKYSIWLTNMAPGKKTRINVVNYLYHAHKLLHHSSGVMGAKNCFKEIIALCYYADIPLEEALRVKMAYNRTRPHRHGGKKV